MRRGRSRTPCLLVTSLLEVDDLRLLLRKVDDDGASARSLVDEERTRHDHGSLLLGRFGHEDHQHLPADAELHRPAEENMRREVGLEVRGGDD